MWAITHDIVLGDLVCKIDAVTQTVIGYFPTNTTNAFNGTGIGLCVDATHVWVPEQSTATVAKILIATGALIGNFATSPGPGSCCVEGLHIWIVCIAFVTKILASTGATIGTFAITSGGQGIVFDFVGNQMWVSTNGDAGNAFTPELVQMSLAGATLSSTPIAVLPPTANGAFLAAILFDGTYLYVIDSAGNNGDNALFLVDPVAVTVLASFSLTVNANAVFGAVFANANIWIANSNFGSMSVLSLVLAPVASAYNPNINTKFIPFFQLPFCVTDERCVSNCHDFFNLI